ncbi:energy-coupling factor transporter transmembrane component T [Methanobacterium petrolearium]|uniref:energy-coupling factor transporter transmembrane component T n=1 Tax=Methanobacterium petrolearium TaxID=710190 RepID=UPI001AE46BBD|nr:energy-coupling factor transporter transmembrane component T [Methanobacterium petrolearium]MBP1946949.1 energy-coupling factor transport system permease protein [Methanobacterium petrolearium]BDZ70909.1 cobalt transporter [Methanobacterium petrolearium]
MNLTIIHPGVYVIYYLLLILLAFMFNDPYYLVSFLICISILIAMQGISHEFKSVIQFFIPMSILIIILNPLASKVGTTHIYIMGSYYITLEALVYGILMSLSLLIILLVFASYNRSVSYQEMLYLFSKRFPHISMIIVMALRFIPLLTYRLSEVNKIFKFNQDEQQKGESRIERIKKTAQMLAVVVSWSLEESMLTAKSMKARGYGIKDRTSYLSYEFRKIDYLFISFIIVMTFISLAGLAQGYGRIEIYPTLKFNASENILNLYYLAFLMLLMPLIYLELREKFIWRQKIKSHRLTYQEKDNGDSKKN